MNSAWFDLLTVQRTLPSRDAETSLLHFDGAVMQSYAYPSRASEVVFCRGNPDNMFCRNGHGFDPTRLNLPESLLEVRQSSLGEDVGRGVFTTKDIPLHSYLALDQVVHPVYISPAAHDLAYEMHEAFGEDSWGKITAIYGWHYGHAFSHHVCEGVGFGCFAPSLFVFRVYPSVLLLYSQKEIRLTYVLFVFLFLSAG